MTRLFYRAKAAYARYRLKRSLYLLDQLDGWLHDAGYSRREIRQFWRELAKRPEHRQKLIAKLR